MSVHPYHGMLKNHIGRTVRIKTKDGKFHHGEITRVTPTHVYLRPPQRNLGGYGYGFWGWGFPLALAAIATFAFWPFFFW